MSRKVYRGDMFFANLNPVTGSEQGGTRPVLIIQNNWGNCYSPAVIVAAISGRTARKSKQPTHCRIGISVGLKKDSLVLLEQIRTIDKRRLQKYIGRLGKADMKKVEYCLAISLGLNRAIRDEGGRC